MSKEVYVRSHPIEMESYENKPRLTYLMEMNEDQLVMDAAADGVRVVGKIKTEVVLPQKISGDFIVLPGVDGSPGKAYCMLISEAKIKPLRDKKWWHKK